MSVLLASMAALAGRLDEIRLRCDVWLVATGAEERIYTGSPDHLGALALARRARARRGSQTRLGIVARRGRAATAPSGCAPPLRSARRREGALLRAGSRARVPVTWVRDQSTGNSDHREFQLLGLPAAKLGVGAGGEPCRHSPCDTPDRLDPVSLRLARRLVERAIGAHSAEPGASRTAAFRAR